MSCLMCKVNVYRLQPIKKKKKKKKTFINVWRPVVRHDSIDGVNVFLLHSGTRVDAERM